MKTRKMLVVLTGLVLLLTVLPVMTAFASVTVIGNIIGVDCASGTLRITSGLGTYNVKITGDTVISLDNTAGSCNDLSIGMRATVMGQDEGGVIVAIRISASSPPAQMAFKIIGYIKSLSCPDSITVQSSEGNISIDISSASITLNGSASDCAKLKIDDFVTVGGNKQNGKYKANYVQAARIGSGSTFQLGGTIETINCPATISVKNQSGTFTVDITNATILLNGQPATCNDLKAGDNVYITGQKDGNTYKAKSLSATRKSTEPFTATGKVITLACGSKIVIEISSGQLAVIVNNQTLFKRDGQSVPCSSIKVGEIVTASGTKDGNTYTASVIEVNSQKTPFAIEGTIDTVACPMISVKTSSNLAIMIDTTDSLITLSGQMIVCSALRSGDSVVIKGETVDGKMVVKTIQAERPITSFTLSGVIKSTTCQTTMIVTAGGEDYSIEITSAVIRLNGNLSNCDNLQIGDIVTVSGIINDGNKIAQVVEATRPAQDETAIAGKVLEINCASGEIKILVGVNEIIIKLPAIIIKNGVEIPCEAIVVGDTGVFWGKLDESGKFVASLANLTSQPIPNPSKSGVILTIDCLSGIINVKLSDGTALIVKIVPGCVITKNGKTALCKDLTIGDSVQIYGAFDGNVFMVNKLDATSSTTNGTYQGKIISKNCALGKIIVDINGVITEVDVRNASIIKNNQPSKCDDLVEGDQITIDGQLDQAGILRATKIEAGKKSGDIKDCNGPFEVTGVIYDLHCLGDPKVIVIKVGNDMYSIKLTSNTKIKIGGVYKTCSDLLPGMTVTIKGNCDTQNGAIATEIIVNDNTTPTTFTVSGTIIALDCYINKISILTTDGKQIVLDIDKDTVIKINGYAAFCSQLLPGMEVTITYKEITENNVKKIVAVTITATYVNPPGGGGGGGGGGGNPPPPPPAPPGGGSTPPGSGSGEKEGSPFESVVTITKYNCDASTIEGTDEYNAGVKVVIQLNKDGTYNYKNAPITCDRMKAGQLIKVKGVRGTGNTVKASSVEILPVSPIPTTKTGRIVEIDKSSGVIKLLDITKQGQIVPFKATGEDAGYITIKIDPSTTFDYRGKKLTLEDLRPGVVMEISGSIDPVNLAITTNTITLAARQAIEATETGKVANVYCEKNLLWLTKDAPENKYILIKLTAETSIMIGEKKVTCSDLVKDMEISVKGMLDPFDLFIAAQSVTGKILEVSTSSIEGELSALDSARQYLWVKVSEASGVKFIQVKYNQDTKILSFGKTGTVADLQFASVLSITGSVDDSNAFIFHATTIESIGKAEEGLITKGSIVFADCASKTIFIKTAKGVERFELTSTTKIFTGDVIAACDTIKEGMEATLVYDKKGTKVFLTKVTLPAPKTTIKLTVGVGVISVNGVSQLIDAPPYIKGGTTMVPIRVITSNFGASLQWNQTDRRLTLQRGKDIIMAWIGRKEALVNGKSVPMAQEPEYGASDRMMVPLRFFSEVFGAEVLWDANTKTVTIIL